MFSSPKVQKHVQTSFNHCLTAALLDILKDTTNTALLSYSHYTLVSVYLFDKIIVTLCQTVLKLDLAYISLCTVLLN